MIQFFKKLFLVIFIYSILVAQIEPGFSLQSRQALFKDALNSSTMGDFDLALDRWNKYLKLFPDDPAALSNRGNVKLVIGDLRGSISDQDSSINLNPNELDPYINRGIAEEALGLWKDARNDYSFVISQDKNNFSAFSEGNGTIL